MCIRDRADGDIKSVSQFFPVLGRNKEAALGVDIVLILSDHRASPAFFTVQETKIRRICPLAPSGRIRPPEPQVREFYGIIPYYPPLSTTTKTSIRHAGLNCKDKFSIFVLANTGFFQEKSTFFEFKTHVLFQQKQSKRGWHNILCQPLVLSTICSFCSKVVKYLQLIFV